MDVFIRYGTKSVKACCNSLQEALALRERALEAGATQVRIPAMPSLTSVVGLESGEILQIAATPDQPAALAQEWPLPYVCAECDARSACCLTSRAVATGDPSLHGGICDACLKRRRLASGYKS